MGNQELTIYIAKVSFIKIISFYRLKHPFTLRNHNDVRAWDGT